MSGTPPPPSPPDYVLGRAAGPYRRLAPTTKLVIGLFEALLAFAAGVWTGPIVVLGLVLASSIVAGVLRTIGVIAALAMPVIGSILLVNTFLFPGATDAIVRIGPLAPTWSGLTFGVQVTLRLLGLSLALALVYLTTEIDDLLTDLEQRGLGRRAVFIVGAATRLVPRLGQRAGEIIEAQRARGLDTEGRWWRRARGVLPLAGPLIFSALTDVEEQAMALEARAFSAPGRRTTLRSIPDTARQRLLRWGLVVAAVALLVNGAGGWVRLP